MRYRLTYYSMLTRCVPKPDRNDRFETAAKEAEDILYELSNVAKELYPRLETDLQHLPDVDFHNLDHQIMEHQCVADPEMVSLCITPMVIAGLIRTQSPSRDMAKQYIYELCQVSLLSAGSLAESCLRDLFLVGVYVKAGQGKACKVRSQN